MKTFNAVLSILALACMFSFSYAYAQHEPLDAQVNKQAMASSPKELVEILENASFLEPAKYDEVLRQMREGYQNSFDLPVIPQVLDEETDPRNDILAEDIEKNSMQMVKFAKMSKDDGNILWGRIQGTKYELMAHQWIRDELKRIGLKDVHYNEMPTQFPQWTPSKIGLEVRYSIPGTKNGKFVFEK